MKKSIIFGSLIVAASFTLAGCGTSSSSPSATPTDTTKTTTQTTATAPAGNEQVVKVTASNFKWDLGTTEVKVGQPVKFVVDSKEGVHGFAIQNTKINKTVAPGAAQEITWTPDKPGTYEIYCSVMCGSGHSNMKTTITVK